MRSAWFAAFASLSLLSARPAAAGTGGQTPEGESAPPKRSSRGSEIFYMNGETGYGAMSFESLVSNGLTPGTSKTSAAGAFFGGGAGLRFGFLTLGGRIRKADFTSFEYTTFDGELGARITVDRLEPYFTFGFGYAGLSTSQTTFAGLANVAIHGWNGRAGIGVDYYPAKAVSFGVNFTGDLVAMSPSGVDLTTSPEDAARQATSACEAISDLAAKQRCLTGVLQKSEGTSFGVVTAVSLLLGLHF